ncbi:MAG: AMP-binding protein [Alphaproteobacteria bacterium]|nr:AMP-binding protein [Alphaproteobacteria bacterium]
MTPIVLTTGQILSAHARLRPDATGVRDLTRTWSFSRWNVRACRLANALTGLGLKKGDRVAVLAYNRLEWAEIYTATAKAGLIPVPINFRLTGPEAAFIINDCGATAVIVEDVLIPTLEIVREELVTPQNRFIQIDGPCKTGFLGYEDLLAAASDREPETVVLPDDPWCLMYTSGTTGNPKGAIRSHRGMAMLALMTDIEFRLHRRDDALLVMPMCHANSLNFFTSFLYCGASITIFSRPSFDPELCLVALGQSTFTSLVPTHYSMMLDIPADRRSNTTNVEKLLISSAPSFASTKSKIMEMFPNSGLFELYGSTEAGWVTMLQPEEQFDHLGTVGREVVGSAPIRFLDDDGNEVPDGQPGELYSSSPYQFDGYWKQPGKTAEAMRGSYLSVGDVGMRDEDGFIRLLDRKKNLIITGGENVYPSEVEQALIKHPDIRDVAVFGVSDSKWGERVVAAVVLQDGANHSAEALITWSRDHLAGFKRPREITFLAPDQMPRNATGKILHRSLRDMYTKSTPEAAGEKT